MSFRLAASFLATLVLAKAPAGAANILFDATKHEMGGNADWVIDADAWNLNMLAFPCSSTTNESNPQRFPTPPQSGIIASTPETYWTGGVSSWAVDLVKAGHTVETLPDGAAITYGDQGNPQDLSHYQIFIVVEPQAPFTPAEKSAILAYVQAGGGLFMVGDHETSDRDCDGWDSPHVWNDLSGATSQAAAGTFGIWMRVNGVEDQGSDDWFNDGTDSNVSTDPTDPIIHGPFGAGTGGLGLFGSTSMELNTADNPTATAHVWRTGQAHDNHRVTFATAFYGAGRVAAIGDSSPADDDTGDPSDSLYGGWDKATGGVNNREIHLNACAWLLNGVLDTAPPLIVSGPAVVPADCSASVSWSTDELSSSIVDYGLSASYGNSAGTPGLTQTHAVALSGLAPETAYHYRVASSDAVGNGPATSLDATFTTTAAAVPAIVTGPLVSSVNGNGATITWTTNEGATATVEYGTTPAYGSSASTAGLTAAHAVPLSGLAPTTEYHFRVLSSDGCGNGPAVSSDGTFTTTAASIDVSGYTLKQYNSSLTYTIPAGTTIPSGGYLVVARDASRAQFESLFPSLPEASVFLNSNASGACANGCLPQVNGGETFELYDAFNVKRDGLTIAMAVNNTYQRVSPGAAPGSPSSWTALAEGSANPGAGAGIGSGAGVAINEMADAPDYKKEFIELYYDAGQAQPDAIPPDPVSSLAAAGTTATTVPLIWIATGNDGSVGTATAYDLRMSLSPIAGDAAFLAAIRVPGVPAPHVAGTPETFTVTGLTPATTYHFALKVRDGGGNVSALSNDASATTTSSTGHLVIAQIRVSGTTDDVVELYNPTESPVSLAGYSVQYLAANGNFGFRVNLNAAASVPARGWYLMAANGYSGAPTRDDSLGTNNMSGTAGHAVLAQTTSNVSCASAAIVDKVGYGGTATCAEGGAGHNTVVPTSGQTVTRKPGGCAGSGTDTEQNDADFGAPAAAGFHNAASPPATPVPTALNDGPVCAGANLQLTASTLSGATYAWSGPNGFSSSEQNPSISGATSAASGSYTVTVNDCTQAVTTATVIANGAACDDLALCTLGDACTDGVCAGQAVVCSAADQCHVQGVCDTGTGVCSNPDAPNGSLCDDGDACTVSDSCGAGSCAGTALPAPGEIGAVAAAKVEVTATFAWDAIEGAAAYDVLRGGFRDWPVGSNPANEVCLTGSVVGTTAADDTVPGTGQGFWYLVRAAGACSDGSYGSQGSGGVPTVPRASTTCP